MLKKELFISAAVLVAMAGMPVAKGFGADSEKPASRPAAKGELKNESCPLTGKPVNADKFIDYADGEKAILGRVYFCCGNCLSKAQSADAAAKKGFYEKAFLTRKSGKAREYGAFRMELGNKKCPVTGEEGVDGTSFIHFNGTKVGVCCGGCAPEFVKDPDKYLHNVNHEIDAAVAKLKEEEKKETGAEK